MRITILKKVLSSLAAAAIVIGGVAYWYATRIPATPFDDVTEDRPMIPPEQGEYAARLSDCVACHSTEGGPPFAGGLEMGTPLGSIFATNITPDKETGIGNYSLADFDNAVRRGVTPDGRRLYPAMPYPSYEKLSDRDVEALYDYFMNHVEPVRQENRPSSIPSPLNMRWPLAFWNGVFTDGETYQADPAQDAVWNRGAYLVQGPGHCGACHTPRGPAMQEVSLDESHPKYLSGTNLDGWYVPSLRNDHNTGLGRWSEQDIVDYLKDGRNKHGVVFGPMAEVVNNSTTFTTNEDLTAIARYLKSLPGDPERDGTPWIYEARATSQGSNNRMPRIPGQQTYETRCSFCHGADGMGKGVWMPPLAGTSALLSDDPSSTINITLNGSHRVVTGGTPDSYRMPPFRAQLSDEDIADLLTYVRGSWGNKASPVTQQAVKTIRETTNPASSEVIILQMR